MKPACPPLMKIAQDGKEHVFKDSIEVIADQFKLTPEERQQLLPSGSAFVINNRIGWARTYLTKAGLLSKPKRGFFQITPRGAEFPVNHSGEISTKMLRQFDEFNDFNGKKNGKRQLSPV